MSTRPDELRLLVTERRQLSAEVTAFSLSGVEGVGLAPYVPGSYLPLRCGAVVNAYSLTDEGYRPDAYRIAVRRSGDAGGSAWLHRNAHTGALLTAATPRSAFPPVLSARKHLLLAAGVGVTPMLSHLRAAARWNRLVELVTGSPGERSIFADEIEDLTRGAPATYTHCRGRVALMRAVDDALVRQPVGTHLYACGPLGFLEQVCGRARAKGWPDGRVHVEHFDAPVLDPGGAFEVTIASAGARITVQPGVSLLTALDLHGIHVDRLCERGVCGRCEIGVRAGTPQHRDLVLTPAERERADRMMACVSRAETDELELDL